MDCVCIAAVSSDTGWFVHCARACAAEPVTQVKLRPVSFENFLHSVAISLAWMWTQMLAHAAAGISTQRPVWSGEDSEDGCNVWAEELPPGIWQEVLCHRTLLSHLQLPWLALMLKVLDLHSLHCNILCVAEAVTVLLPSRMLRIKHKPCQTSVLSLPKLAILACRSSCEWQCLQTALVWPRCWCMTDGDS